MFSSKHRQEKNDAGQDDHEQFTRAVERKDDVPKPTEMQSLVAQPGRASLTLQPEEARQSEFSVSRGGMNQESRDHNKHNNPGQSGHASQQHSPAEEKP